MTTLKDYMRLLSAGGKTLLDEIAMTVDISESIPTTKEGCARVIGIDPENYDGQRDYPKVVAAIRYRFAQAMIEEKWKIEEENP